MERLFVDTGAWFAYFVAGDPDHAAVAEGINSFGGRLLTTDYVFDELVTLIRIRTRSGREIDIGEQLRLGGVAVLETVTLDDFEAAWRFFVQHSDKGYSFTDCTSFAVMRRLGIDLAAAVDPHFRQAGFRVIP